MMKIVKDSSMDGHGKIEIVELMEMSKRMFGSFVKVVVDIEKEIMAVDAELHSDLQELLIENNSEPKNLWGINIYPEVDDDTWIKFDSMINLKPSLGNRTRGVDSPEIREKIIKIVHKLVKK